MSSTGETIAEQLEKEFKTLDPSLIRALVSDHDKPEDHMAEISVLLAALAPPSDPADGDAPPPTTPTDTESVRTESPTATTATDDHPDAAAAHLHAIFPSLPSPTIASAVAAADGVFDDAMDALLTAVWLQEDDDASLAAATAAAAAPRSVDGFATDDSAECPHRRARHHRRDPQAPRAHRHAARDVAPRYAPLRLSTASPEPADASEAAAEAPKRWYAGVHSGTAAEVDAHVAAQSLEAAARRRGRGGGGGGGDGFALVDLHGVTVPDARRICVARAREWWGALGEARAAAPRGRGRGASEGGMGGVEFVTGVGLHSAGGRGVLGGAVLRALVGDGWDVVANEPGVVTVTGRRRK
jgi:hypothetical protein